MTDSQNNPEIRKAEIDLKGRIALVTGSSSGLGRAIAMSLSEAGADIALHYHTERKEADEAVRAITRAGGKAIPYCADVSDYNEVARLFSEIDRTLGTVDILVNNAGIDGPRALCGRDDPKMWQNVVAVNLFGPYYCSREAVTRMERAGRGVIINITSDHEFIPWSGYSAYTSSKAALSMFTRTLAQETAEYGIRVIAVAPGAIRTPINRNVWENAEMLKDLEGKIAMKRMGKPEEISGVVTFLASDLAGYMTGTTVVIDGGMLLYPDFKHGG